MMKSEFSQEEELAQCTSRFASLLDWNLTPKRGKKNDECVKLSFLFNIVPRLYRISSSTSLLPTD